MGEAKRKSKNAVEAIEKAIGVETPGGRIQVRWDGKAAATPFGQMQGPQFGGNLGGRREQLALEISIGQTVRQGPSQARFGEPPKVLANAAAGDLQAVGDLPDRKPHPVLEAEKFTNFMHG